VLQRFQLYALGRKIKFIFGYTVSTMDGLQSQAAALDAFFSQYNLNFVISDPREPDNPIIYASEGFFRMTGYTPAETLNKNCRFLQVRKRDRKFVSRFVRQSLSEG